MGDPAGRPIMLDDLRSHAICSAVERHCSRANAAALAGINKNTLAKWIRRGKLGEEPFATFLRRLREADARSEAKLVSIVAEASEVDAKHAVWLLKVRHKWREPEPRLRPVAAQEMSRDEAEEVLREAAEEYSRRKANAG